MGINGKSIKILKSLCTNLGKKNDPVIAVAIIASFKGILRPTFTLTGKSDEPKARKQYTALREGLTEIIAIPTYICSGKLMQKVLGPKLANKGNLANAKHVLSFMGVCFAALIAIPVFCNLLLPPVMKGFKSYQKKHNKQPDILNNIKLEKFNIQKPQNQQNIILNNFNKKSFSAMKIGN